MVMYPVAALLTYFSSEEVLQLLLLPLLLVYTATVSALLIFC
jgi:hypothetical protein